MTKNTKLSIISLAAGALICTVVRTVVIIGFTDMKTGFLTHGSEVVWNILLYLPMAAAAVLAGVFSRKKLGESEVSPAGCIVLGFAMLITGICAGIEGYLEINSASPTVFLIISDLAGAALMMVLAFIVLYQKRFSAGMGFAGAFSGIYFAARGMYVFFFERMVVTAVPEYFLNAFTLTLGVIFFIMFGKWFTKNDEKHTKFGLCFWGTATAVSGISSSLAVFAAKLLAPAEVSARITLEYGEAERFMQDSRGFDGYLMSNMPYVNLALGVFAAAVVIIALLSDDRENAR